MGNIQFYDSGGGAAILFVGGQIAMDPACCCVQAGDDCNLCEGTGTTPASLLLTVAGIGNNVCGDCTPFQGTFTLDQLPANACAWQYDFPGGVCGYSTARYSADLQWIAGPHVKLTVYLYGDATLLGRWIVNISDADTADCMAIDHDLTNNYDSGDCDFSGATCHATAA